LMFFNCRTILENEVYKDINLFTSLIDGVMLCPSTPLQFKVYNPNSVFSSINTTYTLTLDDGTDFVGYLTAGSFGPAALNYYLHFPYSQQWVPFLANHDICDIKEIELLITNDSLAGGSNVLYQGTHPVNKNLCCCGGCVQHLMFLDNCGNYGSVSAKCDDLIDKETSFVQTCKDPTNKTSGKQNTAWITNKKIYTVRIYSNKEQHLEQFIESPCKFICIDDKWVEVFAAATTYNIYTSSQENQNFYTFTYYTESSGEHPSK